MSNFSFILLKTQVDEKDGMIREKKSFPFIPFLILKE